MAYKKTNWQDTLRDAQGNVIQKGTPLNAQALGKIEDGIVQAEQKIDTEIGKVTTQLAQIPNQTYITDKATKTELNAVASGSPKGVYTYLSELQNAFPTGNSNIYLVLGNVAEVSSLNMTAPPTTSGNVTITLNGVAKTVAVTAGVSEVASLTVSAVPTTVGDITVTLNGVATNIAVDPTTDTTTDAVATKIRNTAFAGWTTGGTGSTVTFTASSVGVKTDSTYNAGTTGTTGTISTTTQGVDADTATSVATKIRSTAFSGWTTGGTGSTVTFIATAVGAKTDSTYSPGSTGASGIMSTTTQGADPDGKWYYWNGLGSWVAGGVYQSTGISPGGVKSVNLANGVVKPEKTTFVKVSSNLYNYRTRLENIAVDGVTGALYERVGYITADIINVNPGETYSTKGFNYVAFYNADMTYLGRTFLEPTGATFTVTANRYIIRLYGQTTQSANMQINLGSTIAEKVDYYETIPSLMVSNENIEEGSVSIKATDFIKVNSTNLFNSAYQDHGYSISETTGELLKNSNYITSDFIEVTAGMPYSTKGFNAMARYDQNKKFISRRSLDRLGQSHTMLGGTYYIKMHGLLADEETFQLNAGSEILPYEPYYVSINGIKLSDKGYGDDSTNAAIRFADKFVIDGTIDINYTSPTVEGIPDLENWKAEQFYSLYDNLVTNYPDYVKKVSLGKNPAGQDVYRYDFKHSPVDDGTINHKEIKMIVVSGVHGGEKAAIISAYNAFKQICSDWKSNELLEILRWNVHFIVVPIANPYGVDNNTRQNGNGVDIARNFPENWILSDVGTSTYSGPNPLSEVETQYLDNLMKENQDAVYFCSFHNFSSNPNLNYFIWNASPTALQLHLGKVILSKMSRKWKRAYNWLPQDNTTFFGWSNYNAPPASESMQARSYGIQGSTFEICERFWLEENGSKFNSTVFTLGTEVFVNWLLLNLKENVDFYNNK